MSNFLSLILIVLSVLLGLFVVKPKYAETTVLKDKKAQHEAALESLRSIEELKQNLENKLNSIAPETMEKIMTLLPESSGSVKLISDIDSIASKYGTTISNVSYNTTPDSSQSLAEGMAQSSYRSTTVSFSVETDYNKFRSILSEIETSLRIVDIRNVSITAAKDKNTYKVDAEIYWLP